MSLPYYPRYPRDFFEGTVGMGFELKAAYGLVLDLIYLKDGRLPDVDKFIAGHLEVSVRKWNLIKSQLLELGKIEIIDGLIRNYRSDKVTESSRLYQDKQRENRSKPNKNNGVQSPPIRPKQNQSEPEPEPDKEETPKPPEGAEETGTVSKTFEACWTAYPHVKTRMSKNKSLAAFRKLPETHRSSLLQAIADYRATLKPRDLEFVKAFHLWLRDRLYEAFLKSNNQSDEEWAARLHYFRKDGTWYDSWGPKPGEAGCEMPSKFLKDQPPQADEF